MSDIRLVSVVGENVRKLTTIATRLDGKPGLFRVTGDNEAGKTTYLDCVAMLFGGKKAVKPDTIQEGKDGGWVKGELSNGYSIERRFTASSPDGFLTVTTPDDAVAKSPQTLLDKWCGGPRSVDPGALLKKRVAEIESIILSLANVEGLEDQLAVINAKRSKLTEERRPWNSAKQRAERTPRPLGTRPEPVDVSGEMERLQLLRADQAVRESVAIKCDRIVREREHAEEMVRQARQNLAGCEHTLSEKGDEVMRARADLAATVDLTEAIAAVEDHIRDSDTVSAELEPWNEYDRAQQAITEAADNSIAITEEIEFLAAEEAELLSSAEIPVRGISFNDRHGMVLDGHPIEVASGMRRLEMARDIAFAGNPDVKVCLLDEANAYSTKALEHLNTLAEEKGWQVLACRLGELGAGEIVVEDGAAVTP